VWAKALAVDATLFQIVFRAIVKLNRHAAPREAHGSRRPSFHTVTLF
jgi:hypothetical protein